MIESIIIKGYFIIETSPSKLQIRQPLSYLKLHSNIAFSPIVIDEFNSKPQASPSDISLCPNCNCMTKNIVETGRIYCGKCKKEKARSDNNDFKAHKSSPKDSLKFDIQMLKNSFDKSRVYSKEDIEAEMDEIFGNPS